MGHSSQSTVLDNSLHAAQVEFFWSGLVSLRFFGCWDPIPQCAVIFFGSDGSHLDFCGVANQVKMVIISSPRNSEFLKPLQEEKKTLRASALIIKHKRRQVHLGR